MKNQGKKKEKPAGKRRGTCGLLSAAESGRTQRCKGLLLLDLASV
jgi:hypothetical protein